MKPFSYTQTTILTEEQAKELNMKTTHFLKVLYSKFYPKRKKALSQITLPEKWLNLSAELKEKKAQTLIALSEKKLLSKNIDGLKDLHFAALLFPKDHNIWYRLATALFDFGMKEKNPDLLEYAEKSFEIAINLNNQIFQYFWGYGNLLFEMGSLKNKEPLIQRSKEALDTAINLSNNETKAILAELYWDLGLVWSKLSDFSGEAIDVRKAIQSLRISFAHQTKILPSFWYEFGLVHLKMALLINDNASYLQAIDYLEKAVQKDPYYFDAYLSLARCFVELYINTLDPKYFEKANFYFQESYRLNPLDTECLLEWSQLLAEFGLIKKDEKKLLLSIEKCQLANSQNSENLRIIAQWAESLANLGKITGFIEPISEANKMIEQALQKNQKIYELWYAFGTCQEALADYYNDLDYLEEAIEKFQKALTLCTSSAESLHRIANNFRKFADELNDEKIFLKAKENYISAIKLKPSFPQLHYDLALCMFLLSNLSNKKDDVEEAIHNFEIALQFHDEYFCDHPEWLISYSLALRRLGDIKDDDQIYLKAIEILYHVLLINPDLPKIHFHLATTFAHLSESFEEYPYFSQAWKFFELAIKQNPEDDEALLEWGLSLISFAKQNPFVNSVDYFLLAEQKLLQSAKLGNEHCFYYLAGLHALKGRIEVAIEWLSKAEKQLVLPPLEEVLKDDWLEPLFSHPKFQLFITYLEAKELILKKEQ